jgi:hypothetical protein
MQRQTIRTAPSPARRPRWPPNHLNTGYLTGALVPTTWGAAAPPGRGWERPPARPARRDSPRALLVLRRRGAQRFASVVRERVSGPHPWRVIRRHPDGRHHHPAVLLLVFGVVLLGKGISGLTT